MAGNTAITTKDGVTKVIFYSTAIVSFNAEEIVLNTDSYWTNTTKARMNEASKQFDLGFKVYQKAKKKLVDYRGDTIPFTDGMILKRRIACLKYL